MDDLTDPLAWHPEDGQPMFGDPNYASRVERWERWTIDQREPEGDRRLRNAARHLRTQMGDVLPRALIVGVARRIVGMDAPELGTTPALDTVEFWLKARKAPTTRPMLGMVAGAGAGKTVAAARVLTHPLSRYITARDAAKLGNSLFGDTAERWAEVLAAPVLVIDEIGAWGDRTHEPSALTEAIDRRQFDKTTVLITNLTAPALDAFLGERAASRLALCASIATVSGPDLRRKAHRST